MNTTPDNEPETADTKHVFEVGYSERDDGLADFRVCAEGVPRGEAIATIVQLVGSLSAGMGLVIPPKTTDEPEQEAP